MRNRDELSSQNNRLRLKKHFCNITKLSDTVVEKDKVVVYVKLIRKSSNFIELLDNINEVNYDLFFAVLASANRVMK